jgi:hypothetical protein
MIHFLEAFWGGSWLARLCHSASAQELLDTLINISSASVDPGSVEIVAAPLRAEKALR